MAADIDAQDLFFKRIFELVGELAHIGHADLKVLFVLFVGYVKKAHLAGHVMFAGGLQVVQDAHVDAHHLLSGGTQAVQGARFDKALHGPAVDILFLTGHPGEKVPEVAEGAAQAALLQDGFNDGAADALDGGQGVVDAGRRDGKARLALVDVGRKDPDLHGPAGENIGGHLGGVVDHRGHESRHEFHGIIIFEPGGLVGDDGVAGGVGLVEGVFGKVHHSVVDAGGNLFIDPAGRAAGNVLLGVAVDEVPALLFHDGLFLFTHGPADQVAPAQGVAAQVPDDLHDLLLVHDAAVGRLQDGFQLRTGIVDRVPVVLAGNILGDEVHGPRPVKGDAGDDVLKIPRPQFLHEVLHTAGFKLEDSVRPAGGDVSVDSGVGVIEKIHGDHRA